MRTGFLSHAAWRKAEKKPLPTVRRMTDDILNGITLRDPKCDCCTNEQKDCDYVPLARTPSTRK